MSLRRRIHALRRKNIALEREKAKLVAMLYAAPVGMAFLDPALRILRANGAIRRIAGGKMSRHSPLAETFPLLAGELEPLCRGVLKTGKPVIDHEICRHSPLGDGCAHCWLATVYAVPGRAPGLVLILSDRTSAKAAADRAAEARLLEVVGRLAGGIAHDFNNLLVGIMGGTSLALEDLEKDHPARQNLELVLRSGERAAELTRLLLAYSGKGLLFRSRVDVASVVRETCAGLRPLIPPQVRLELRSEPRLPPLLADGSQIAELARSLVLNAAEAIGDKKGEIHVYVGIARVAGRQTGGPSCAGGDVGRGRYIVLEVSDTGCGMDEATRTRIFDPFFTTKFTGRGLGLAAVQGIVRNLNGSIRVSSSPGQGSTFTIFLKAPAHVAAATA